MTDQSADIPNVQIAEPGVLLGLLTGMWLRGYSKDQKRLTGNCITKDHPAWVTDTKARNLEYTVQLGSKQDNVFSW